MLSRASQGLTAPETPQLLKITGTIGEMDAFNIAQLANMRAFQRPISHDHFRITLHDIELHAASNLSGAPEQLVPVTTDVSSASYRIETPSVYINTRFNSIVGAYGLLEAINAADWNAGAAGMSLDAFSGHAAFPIKAEQKSADSFAFKTYFRVTDQA